MILVTLGTQKQQFTRLLDYIENSKITDQIVVQAGYTKYESKKMKIFDFISYDEMNEYVKKSDIVITHGGTGSITGPLKLNKKVIACARKQKYGEHVDDHQEQLVDVFSEAGYILKLDENIALDELIKKDFQPQKFESNNEKFINSIKQEIEQTENHYNSFLLIVLFLMYLFLGIGLLIVRTPKDISFVENRTLNKIDLSLIKKFNQEKFQKSLESGIEDQIFLSQTMKLFGNKINNFTSDISLNLFYDFDSYNIVPATRGLYYIKGTDYLVYGEGSLESDYNASINNLSNIKNIATKYPNIKVFAFKVTRETDFRYRDQYDALVSSYLEKKIKYSSFEVNSYDDYMKYFYKSDHHWNNVGQYEGYKEIIQLLGINKYIEINNIVCFKDIKYWGSQARIIGNVNLYDDFCINKYKLNDFEVILPKNYIPLKENYNNNIVPNAIDTAHYSNYYGADYGEIHIKNKNNNENMLIFVDSFSNPINELIASHYQNTYIIDLRNYQSATGKNFILKKYLSNKNISNILFLGNINFFVMSDFFVEIGE